MAAKYLPTVKVEWFNVNQSLNFHCIENYIHHLYKIWSRRNVGGRLHVPFLVRHVWIFHDIFLNMISENSMKVVWLVLKIIALFMTTF